MSEKKTALKLTVIGGGPLGRAIARILQEAADVHIWARREETQTQLRDGLQHTTVHDDFGTALKDAKVVILAVPADQLLDVCERYGEFALGDQVVLTAARGVGPGFQLPHEMIRARTCVRKIGILGGPIHARELAKGRRINAVLASRYPEVQDWVLKLTKASPIALHRSRDIIGVQVAGAISNVSSLAAGMADALELGDTARGVLLTHGLVDAKKIGVALGASERTFGGLAGIGELIPRHVTSMDRHLNLGAQLARGESLETALGTIDGHVEGVLTAREAMKLAEAKGLELLLVRAVAQVLDGQIGAREALEDVLHSNLELDE